MVVGQPLRAATVAEGEMVGLALRCGPLIVGDSFCAATASQSDALYHSPADYLSRAPFAQWSKLLFQAHQDPQTFCLPIAGIASESPIGIALRAIADPEVRALAFAPMIDG